MKRLLLLLLFFLVPITAFAQSTTVSGTVTDSSSQTWNNGSYSFSFVGIPNYPGPYSWTGGAFNPLTTVSGSLSNTGTFSASVPSNTAISPVGTTWTLQVCPQSTGACFTQSVMVTGATQTVNPAPPAISVPPGVANSVYATSQVAGGTLGSLIYVIGGALNVCTAVTSGACSTWSPTGGGGGGGITPPAGDICGTAIAPTICGITSLPTRAITGSTSTDTILSSDSYGIVEHDYAGSAGVTERIPTPTTLGKPNMRFTYINHAANEVDAIAPAIASGWTMTVGTNGTPVSNVQVQPGAGCVVYVDPVTANNWIADCQSASGFTAIINGICYSNLKAFGSLDARINACNTDNNNGLVSSHIIDSTGEGGTQQINSQITLGKSSNDTPVELRVPPQCTWNVNSGIGSSSSTGNAIFMYSGALIEGNTLIQNGGCQLKANFSDFQVYSFINTNSSIYWYVKGLETYNPTAFTASGFNSLFTGGDDMSGIENFNSQAYQNMQGTITTSGTTATCVTGCTEFGSIPVGSSSAPPILINNVLYFITANSGTALTLSTSAGTQTAVPFTYGQWDNYMAAGCCGFTVKRMYLNNNNTGGGTILTNGGTYDFITTSPLGHTSPGFPGMYCANASILDIDEMYSEMPSATASTVSTTSISGNQYTLTWVSGQQFYSFYTGLQLTISGNVYTVLAGFSNTSATITSNVGTPSTVTGVTIAIPNSSTPQILTTNCRLHVGTIYASAVSSTNGSSTVNGPIIQQNSTGNSGYRLDVDHMYWLHSSYLPQNGILNLGTATTPEQAASIIDTLGNFGAYHYSSSGNLQGNLLAPNTYDRIQGQVAVQVGQELQQEASSTVASATSIAPTYNLTHITGSTTINTIATTNLPNVVGINGTLSTNSTGNIATLITGPTFGFVGMLPGWNLYIAGTAYAVASVPTSATGTVNTDGAGTTITYSTGTNFASLQVGAIVTIGGTQTTIQTITSNTNMTVSPAVGINLTGASYTGSYVFITSGPTSSVSASYTALPPLRSTTRITLVMDGTAAIGIGGNITSGVNPIAGTSIDLIYDPLSTACAVPTQGTLGCWMPVSPVTQTIVSNGSGPAGYSGSPSLSTTPTFVPFIGGGAGSATVGNVGTGATSAAPISGLQVVMSATPPTTAVVTLTDGSTGEALTCTVTNPATTCSDLVHSFTPAIGDKLSYSITLGSSTQTPTVQISAAYGAPNGSTTTGADMLWNTGQTGYLPGTTVATTGIPVLGTAYVYKVIPQHNIWVGHASMYVSTGQASGVGYVCIYTGTASANVWNANFAVTTSTAVATGSATQFLLQAGTPYYIAAGQFGSVTGATVETWDNTLANLSTLINTSGNFFATAANGFSGAACPATLGTLTNITASNTVSPLVLLGP